MKKTKISSLIVIAVALVFHLVGVVLLGVSDNFATFNIIPLANSLRDIGLFTAILAGAVFIATIIIALVKDVTDKSDKK